MFLLVSHNLNPISKDAQQIKKIDKKMVANLYYKDTEFLQKVIIRLNFKKRLVLMCLDIKNRHVYSVYLLKEKFENHLELLLIVNEDNF